MRVSLSALVVLVACCSWSWAGEAPERPTGLTDGQWALANAAVGYQAKTEDELADGQKTLVAMQHGKVDARRSVGAIRVDNGVYFYSTAANKKYWIAWQLKVIQGLKDRLAKLKGGEIIYPDLLIDPLAAGAIGMVKYPENYVDPDKYKVCAAAVQVESDSEMLVKLGGQLVWLSGYSTASIVDGKLITITGPHYVPGTKHYQTLAGQKTVFILEPVKLDGVNLAVQYLRSVPAEK
jgi:hypothetical protein